MTGYRAMHLDEMEAVPWAGGLTWRSALYYVARGRATFTLDGVPELADEARVDDLAHLLDT